MNKELIMALDALEKENGIDKEIMFAAIEKSLMDEYKAEFDKADNCLLYTSIIDDVKSDSASIDDLFGSSPDKETEHNGKSADTQAQTISADDKKK